MIENYHGPWMQLIGIVVKFYKDVQQVLESNNINYPDFDISDVSLETDLNEDLELLLENIKSKQLYQNRITLNQTVRQIKYVATKFREEIHRSELLLILAAFRRDDGLPLLDMFNKIEIEDLERNSIYCLARTRTEFLQQILGDGSFLGSYYKVPIYSYTFIYLNIF